MTQAVDGRGRLGRAGGSPPVIHKGATVVAHVLGVGPATRPGIDVAADASFSIAATKNGASGLAAREARTAPSCRRSAPLITIERAVYADSFKRGGQRTSGACASLDRA